MWKHGGAIPHLRTTRRTDSWRKLILLFDVKGQIGSEYLSQHWQRLSLSLRRSKNVFGSYPSSLKISKLCFETTTTQSAIVRRCRFFFWLSSSTWGAFFWCCLIHLTDLSLFRKGHVLHLTEKQKRSSFPNHHWTATEPNARNFTPSITTQQISRENKAFKVSNLDVGGAVKQFLSPHVTLYDTGLERIRCMKSRQSFSRLTCPATLVPSVFVPLDQRSGNSDPGKIRLEVRKYRTSGWIAHVWPQNQTWRPL